MTMQLKYGFALSLLALTLLPLSTAARMMGDVQRKSVREIRASANLLPSNAEGRKRNIQKAVEELNRENVKRDTFCEKGLCFTLGPAWNYPKVERSFDTTNRRVIIARQHNDKGNRASAAVTSFVIKKNATPESMMQFAMTLFTTNAGEISLSAPAKIKAGTFDAYVSDYGTEQTDKGRLVIILTNPKKKLGHILLFRAYPAAFFEQLSGEFDLLIGSLR